MFSEILGLENNEKNIFQRGIDLNIKKCIPYCVIGVFYQSKNVKKKKKMSGNGETNNMISTNKDVAVNIGSYPNSDYISTERSMEYGREIKQTNGTTLNNTPKKSKTWIVVTVLIVILIIVVIIFSKINKAKQGEMNSNTI